MDKKPFLSADLIAALEKAVVDGKYDGTREENKLLRKAYDLYVDGNAASGDDYTAALKVVIEKQAKREEKKKQPQSSVNSSSSQKKTHKLQKGRIRRYHSLQGSTIWRCRDDRKLTECVGDGRPIAFFAAELVGAIFNFPVFRFVVLSK